MNRRSEKPGAVIIGGSFHSLGAARNLAKHGVPVCVLDSGVCVSQFSRHVKHFLKCPPLGDEAGFVEFLVRIAAERNMDGWVVFPSTYDSVRILAQHRERLSEHYTSVRCQRALVTLCWGETPLENAPGLLYRRDGTVVSGPAREIISDVDTIPFPRYIHFDLGKYTQELPLVTSRGEAMKGADTSHMESSEQILERIRQCMTRALELDEAEVRNIGRNTTAADLEKWDSLGHLRLIVELEESFGIAFDDEQVVQLASVQRIMQVVGNNGR